MREDLPIAVIGMGCRFPGAPDPAAFWDNIQRDVYSIAPMPASRFNRTRYFDPEIGAYGKSYCQHGGLIDDHPFDARGVLLPPKVIESTDLAHLWALEVARATLDDAGFEANGLQHRNVGVVVGHARGSMMTADLAFSTASEGMLSALDASPELAALGPEALEHLKQRTADRVHARYSRRTEDGGIGSMASGLTGLISNVLGLRGRHMVVDAACASSFAALDIGMRALRRGRLELALVGGASYSQELSVIMFAQSRALSPDGSFPFDRRASGFISSDGIAFVLLERLDDALRNGHNIRAIIRGVGGACDGKGRALWAPRKEGQVLAIRRAYEAAGVDPSTIGLIEGHATSTPIGDRTEIEAVDEVFGRAGGVRRKAPLPIGSVKGNIGHTRETAGAAGLVKAILALEHQTIPPTGNFRDPSPEIPWSDVAIEVSTAARPWTQDTSGPRRAGVDAFGIGGLDYHVIVEEAPPARRVVPSAGVEPPTASVEGATSAEPLDIAIVGVGVRFPGGKSRDELFGNLRTKAELFVDVPGARWKKEIYHQPGDRAAYRTYAKKGAFLTDFEADWKRYKVPPKLVERNDPLQFMLLESALDALDDAKVDVEKIDRTRVAVLVGSVFGSDYALELSLAIRAQELTEDVVDTLEEIGSVDASSRQHAYDLVLKALRAPLPSINEDSSGSFSSSTLASRTSKTLDLMGPACAVDAACASSLASLEAACEMLRSGSVDLALYGGGDRAMRVQRYEAYCQFYALSRTDQAHPFDAAADGFLPGEGAGVCVLKRLEDALRDGDHVYAVVKGIGSSADGERKGLHKPSARALASAMTRALDEARVDPKQVAFVECHGAGTPVGDATEVEAVRATYHPEDREKALVLGSVKGNLGHTQGAAGVLSVIKTALALDRGELPPTKGFEAPNPAHALDDTLRVTKEPEVFPRTDAGGLAGVSSMGIAGINYHAILAPLAEAENHETKEEATMTGAPLDTRSPEHHPSDLPLFEGPEAAALLAEPGFQEFWARTQPGIAALVENLWAARRGLSALPSAATRPALAAKAATPARPATPAMPTNGASPLNGAREALGASEVSPGVKEAPVLPTPPARLPAILQPTPTVKLSPPELSALARHSTAPSAKPSAPELAKPVVQAGSLAAVPASALAPKNGAETPSTVPTLSATPARPIATRAEVEEFITSQLCAETGYPRELVDPNADLEADLGIDTVKQAQVLGRVRDHFDIRTDEKLSLRDFPSIAKMLDYVEKELQKKAARAASEPAAEVKVSRVPMLDLTERRGAKTSAPGASLGPKAAAPKVSAVAPAPKPAPSGAPASTGPTAPASSAPPAVQAAQAAKPAIVAPKLTAGPSPAVATSAPRQEIRAASESPRLVDAAPPRLIEPVGAPVTAAMPTVFLHLTGTAREIGEQHGEALREQIREVMDRYEAFLGERGQQLLELPAAVNHVLSLFDQPSLDELEGVARAAAVPFKHLLAYNLDAALFPAYVAGCTQAVRLGWANDGTMLHLVNEDSPLLLHLGGYNPRTVQIRRRTDALHPHRRVVLFTVAGQGAGASALNDAGLTVTSTTLLDGPQREGIPEGAPHPQLVKRVAEEASSLAEAMTIARTFPKTGRWSLLVSDAERDEAGYLEYDDNTILREEFVTRGKVTTNHALSGAATGCLAPEHSIHRATRAEAMFEAAKPLTVARAKELLRDREDLGRGRTVAHPTMNTVRRVDNVMSLVVEPKARRFHVTDRVVPPGATGLANGAGASGGATPEDGVQFVTLGYGGSTIATRASLFASRPPEDSRLPHPEPASLVPGTEVQS